VPFTLIHAVKYRTKDKLITENTQTEHNTGKANNTKYSKTKLAWFSHFLRHSARKWGGFVLQRYRAQTGARFDWAWFYVCANTI